MSERPIPLGECRRVSNALPKPFSQIRVSDAGRRTPDAGRSVDLRRDARRLPP
jgi:hypothetical protein